MSKKLLTMILLSIFLYANETNDTIEGQLGKCEDIYVACSTKCEEADNSDIEKCIESCEKTYYECETRVIESFEKKAQD